MNNATEQIFLASSSGTQAPPGPPKPGSGPSPVNLDSVEDFSKVCRVCASITELFMPIFSGEGLQNNLADKIHKHLPIKVCESDSPGLPVVVCYQCAGTLLATHELVECSSQADAALRARAAALAAQQEKKRAAEDHDTTGETDQWQAGPPSSDDERPLADVASERANGLYDAFYSALLNFRNHFVSEHEARASYPEFTDSGSERSTGGGADLAGVDDLSARGLRRGRLDSPTRAALARARVRVDGRVAYGCGACGKRLSSAHTFVFHCRIHTGERPCVCHVCGKQFRAPNGLQRHVAETHERRRRRACRHCARTFANSQNLKQHLRTHTGERPYACALCPKRFAHAGSLHAHRKTHSAARPHRCAHCPAAFRLRAGLARHARAHAGQRAPPAPAPPAPRAGPHACAACPAAFRSRRALRHHARRDHAAPPPPDPAPPANRSYFVLASL